jgi:hypothetical protein
VAIANRAQLIREAFGGDRPTQYKGIFNQAFTDLGQSGPANEDVVVSGSQELAEAYVDGYLKKTGQLPKPEEVTDFVANNALPRNILPGELTGTLLQPKWLTLS